MSLSTSLNACPYSCCLVSCLVFAEQRDAVSSRCNCASPRQQQCTITSQACCPSLGCSLRSISFIKADWRWIDLMYAGDDTRKAPTATIPQSCSPSFNRRHHQPYRLHPGRPALVISADQPSTEVWKMEETRVVDWEKT